MNKPSATCIFGIIVLLLPCSTFGQAQESVDQQLKELAYIYVESYFNRFPELATFRNIPGADHSSISDPSPKAVKNWDIRIDSLYNQFQKIDDLPLQKSEAWVTYGYLREKLETSIQTRICREELWDVDQVNGWQVTVSKLASLQPVGTERLRTSALQRFGQIPKYVDIHIQNLREGLRRGYSSPKENVQRVLDQLDTLLDTSPEHSPLADPARRDSTPAFQKAFSQLIDEAVNPAIRRYQNFLSKEYLPAVNTKESLTANPNWTACYRSKLREYTTQDISPQMIHKLGLQTRDVIKSKINEIISEHAQTPDFFTSRLEILQAAESAVEKARAEIPNWFGTLPKTELTVVPMPSYLEDSGPAGRYFLPTEENRPAGFQINLKNLTRRSRASLEKLAYHEAMPGHHLQQAIAFERTDAHPITRYFGYSAFIEGWAHYAESLADEMGIYTSERARLVMLRSQLLNAEYLILDTGLHYLGWTRQQAIDYLSEHMGGDPDNIARLIDYIIIWPGQSTSYMVGYQQIQQLRAKANAELGDSFDIARFHDVVLGSGAITLPMLREKIEYWISSQ